MRRISAPRWPPRLGLGLGLLALGVLGPVDHLRLFLAQSCGDLYMMPICVEIKSVSTLARMSRWGLTSWVRHEATSLLGDRREPAAKEVLRARIAETSDATLWGIALEPFDRADKAALAVTRPDLVVEAFQSYDRIARHSAAFAARTLGDPKYAPWCVALLDDIAPMVRHQAVMCVARLGPGPYLDDLQRLTARETDNTTIIELANLGAQMDDPKGQALGTQAEAKANRPQRVSPPPSSPTAAPAADAPPPGR